MNILEKTYRSTKAFTLVELIVTITILAILGTIAFISLQGYSKLARNSTRIVDMQSIKNVLELHVIKYGKYPLPDSSTLVTASGTNLWHTGEVATSIQTQVGRISKIPEDPLTGKYMNYSTTLNQKEYQLMYDFEVTQQNNITNSTYASETTFPKVVGQYNGFYVIGGDNKYYASPSLHADGADLSAESTFHVDTHDTLFTVQDLGVNTSNISGNYANFTTNLHSAYSGSTDLSAGEYNYLSGVNLGDNNDLENFAVLLLGGKLVSYACSAEPSIGNAVYYNGTATSDDQSWSYDISATAGCSWKCNTGFVKSVGDACIPPTPIVWTGGASTSWSNTANWDLGRLPTSSDAVTIDANATISLDTTGGVEVYSLEIGGTNATTLQLSGLSELTMIGDITVKSNGTIIHVPNTTSKVNIVNIVASSMTLESGGYINADFGGYNKGTGPGNGVYYVYESGPTWYYTGGGGGYGGAGASGFSAAGGPSYGSSTEPIDIGSGGGNWSYGGKGGGAIQLHIAGSMVLDGVITTNGADGTGTMGSTQRRAGGGGSGGSVWIEAGDISGTGYIYANGGNAYYHATYPGNSGGGGGGGRVAIHYTTSSFSLASHVIVDGGKKNNVPHGAVGTEYTQQN
ncbi:type II secretion system protein [Candidatus Gracilibacteria bacterium 28_42_T64]|nr:type II secretion system protein [Candidatus Gracilibacteria bacterium 28_42_T64]